MTVAIIRIVVLVIDKSTRRLLLGRKVVTNHSEGDQPWDFFRRNDAKAEASVLWPPHGKS